MRVLVIGESCDDVFIYGEGLRLSPEAPVPVIKPLRETNSKGMAENVELNLNALGIETHLICNNEKVTKIRYVDDSYNYILLRIDENDVVSPFKLTELPNLDDFDLVVFADYDKGFLSKSDILEISSKCNCPTFLDTKKKLGDWCKEISFIKINYHEYLRSKTKIDNNTWLKNKTIITRGPNGCDFVDKNYPTKNVGVKDVAGAGDSFLAGLIFKYIQTRSIQESLEFANKCSTQVVQQKGVSIINKELL
jgi:D-beta-D-heptose 7-phosphate kinase/D-beta-D-heptose 1-phosphate adenosyltransferase